MSCATDLRIPHRSLTLANEARYRLFCSRSRAAKIWIHQCRQQTTQTRAGKPPAPTLPFAGNSAHVDELRDLVQRWEMGEGNGAPGYCARQGNANTTEAAMRVTIVMRWTLSYLIPGLVLKELRWTMCAEQQRPS